jgi:hypothetical protein
MHVIQLFAPEKNFGIFLFNNKVTLEVINNFDFVAMLLCSLNQTACAV